MSLCLIARGRRTTRWGECNAWEDRSWNRADISTMGFIRCLSSYDRNNWVETPESLEMKAGLEPDAVLIEGKPSAAMPLSR